MIQSLSTARAGLTAQQQKIDIISNNIANISTTAFKSTHARFKDTLYTAMENPAPGAGAGNLQKGTGTALSSTVIDFSQGGIRTTGNRLDFMIEGNAFFKLETADDVYAYTKDGSFNLSVEEKGSFLVNSDGYYVLDVNDGRIMIPAEGSGAFSVRDDGSIELESTEIQLGIYTFDNAAGLEPAGGSLFSESTSSGEAAEAADYTVLQGSIEGSNVDLASELTRLIEAQRVFSLAGKALQTADNMEGLANNLRR